MICANRFSLRAQTVWDYTDMPSEAGKDGAVALRHNRSGNFLHSDMHVETHDARQTEQIYKVDAARIYNP